MDGLEKGRLTSRAAQIHHRESRIKRRTIWWALLANTALWLVIGNLVVWGPIWLHWRVSPARVSSEVIERDRLSPADAVLDVVAETSMMTDHPLHGKAAAAAAERLLKGELVLPALPVIQIDPAFSRRDLSAGVPVQQVFTASLIVPDLLLRAHKYQPDPKWVVAAVRYTRGFSEYEAGVQFPRDFVRNSHAAANRIAVLARLWRNVRSAADYDRETGRMIHQHAQRLGALLSKPSTFIASTNQGVMQNIGLLQLAAAFPELPDAARWRTLALQRLELQRDGWISAEGPVLEHSAGYHFHGVVLSGYVLKLLEVQGIDAPQGWIKAHNVARHFLQSLQRPDRSLPAYGNTFRYAWQLPAVLGVNQEEWDLALKDRESYTSLLPASGHAVWWSADSEAGPATHTHIPWGYFSGHGHRRAQELALTIWADGTDWSTGTGYWPGEDDSGIAITNGWDGGNGPHVRGEPIVESRHSVVRARLEREALRFLDIERVVPVADGRELRVRRQIVQWRGSTWATLDTFSDPMRRDLRVLWTAAPESTQRQVADREFRFERPGSSVAMAITVDGGANVTTRPLRGSLDPFGGWVAFDRKAQPAPAVEAQLPASAGWMLTVLRLSPALQRGINVDRMTRYADPEHWTLSLDGKDGRPPVTIGRAGGELVFPESTTEMAQVVGVPLGTAADPGPELQKIAGSREILLRTYPRYATNEWLRKRQSQALAALWAVTTLGLAIWAALRRRSAVCHPK